MSQLFYTFGVGKLLIPNIELSKNYIKKSDRLRLDFGDRTTANSA
ncbi:hypothetical protein [Nostoc sp. CENA543]|nr:hypothetical protein [Nostoc sp. CENA543]